MKLGLMGGAVLAIAAMAGCATSKPESMGNLGQGLHPESYYLPNAEASRVVTVTRADAPGGGQGDRAEGDGGEVR